MEKILAPTDRVLTEIGRLVLVRPLFSSILLIAAMTITFISNLDWNISNTEDLALAADLPIAVPTHTQATISSNTGETIIMSSPVAKHATNITSKWQTLTVRSGDTLSTLFKNNGFSTKQALAVSRLSGAKALRHPKPGQEMRFYKDAEGQLQQLAYAVSSKSTLNVIRSGHTYKASTRAIPISAIAPIATGLAANTVQVSVTPVSVTKIPVKEMPTTANNASTLRYASGRISQSLTADARKAGLSAKQVNQLVQIFSPRNLAQKLHAGDEFSVLYENPTKKTTASKKSTGNILAAQLVISDKTYQLIRFTDPKGHTDYYNPQGQNLRDGILRIPMRFGRVNSNFSRNRLDPVLGFRRPHAGIDFGAAPGTPVQASGDGVLAEVGYKGGYGKAIVIQHDGKYSTLYAHLSKFASGVREGRTIHKGQTIGYVGQTGFATGPHLHYEIRVNDVATNPMTVALPGTSIPKAYRNQFLMRTKMLLAQLNISKRQVRLAQRADLVKRS